MLSFICTSCSNRMFRSKSRRFETAIRSDQQQAGNKSANMREDRYSLQIAAGGKTDHQLDADPCQRQPDDTDDMAGNRPDRINLVARKQQGISPQYR